MSGRNGYNSGPSRSPLNATTFSVKKLLLCALLLLLVFPHTSHEFFQISGADKSGNLGSFVGAIKPIAKRPFEKKFKFHKIERLYIDDAEDMDDDDSKDDRDDENDDVYNDSKKRREDTSQLTDASEPIAESEELPFKRASTTQKERRAATAVPNGKKRSTTKKQKDIADNEINKSEESKTFLTSLFDNLFSIGTRDQGNANQQQKATDPTNGIIDWLKWLGERSERVNSPETEDPDNTESWLSYLNRWPFNSLFPFGKPAKPIRMPRSSRQSKQPVSADNGDSDEADITMSQENFETILHTLPSFVVNPAQVTNTECRQQLQIFHRQLRGNKLWTLQMLDATGKITAGLLRGNINQFGDFDQCMQVKTVVKVTPEIPVRIRGKYCLAHIEVQTSRKELKVPLHYVHGRALWRSHFGNPNHFVPRYDVANWGVCIPHLCNGEIVQQMIRTDLQVYNATGVEFHVQVDENDCYTRSNVKFGKLITNNRKLAFTISCICGLVALCIGSLLHKYSFDIIACVRKKLTRKTPESNDEIEESESKSETVAHYSDAEDEQVTGKDTEGSVLSNRKDEHVEASDNVLHTVIVMIRDIASAFSPQRTFAELLGSDHLECKFPIFNVLKLAITFALYVVLKYIMIGHLPIINRDELVRTFDQPQSILFRSPMIYMDALLMISGFLSAYQLAEEMEQRAHIKLLKRMALKITRYLPTLYVVLLLQTCILPLLGGGPLWTNLIGQNTNLCEQQMWRNFFSVQNAIDFEETCSPMTIQLALEVQLYILGPLIVWLYYTDADAAFFIYGALHAMSVAARYSRTKREFLSMTLFHGMNVSKFYRTANLLFSSPVSRTTPYLIGIGTGLLHRSHAGALEIASELKPIGWLCAILGLLWCFWYPSAGMRTDFVYTAGDAASYAAWCPLIVGLALAWCIFMFPNRENSALCFLTSMRPLLFLSRITFPIQLMTYVVVLFNTAGISESRKFNFSDLVNYKEIGVILASGIAFAFLIDIPAQYVRKVVINRLFVERSASGHEHETDRSSGAEGSEAEAEADADDDADADADAEAEADANNEDHSEHIKDDLGDIWRTKDNSEDLERSNIVETADEGEQETTVMDGDVPDREKEISEEDEIKKRPETDGNEEGDGIYTRRRRRISDD